MKNRSALTLLWVWLLQACQVALAADVDHGVQKAPNFVEPRVPTLLSSPWFARLGVVGVFYDSSARIVVNGQEIPGASASVSNNVTVTFDIGYDLTENFALSLMLGVPAKPTFTGEGAIASLGELGKVLFGPAVLSGYYRWPSFAGIRPYTGAGVAYAVVFKNFDAAVTQVNVHNGWGFALQGGAEYKLNDRFDLFVDYKKIWISLNADGLINGVVPATARAKLDPTLISAGLKFHFP